MPKSARKIPKILKILKKFMFKFCPCQWKLLLKTGYQCIWHSLFNRRVIFLVLIGYNTKIINSEKSGVPDSDLEVSQNELIKRIQLSLKEYRLVASVEQWSCSYLPDIQTLDCILWIQDNFNSTDLENRMLWAFRRSTTDNGTTGNVTNIMLDSRY